MQKQFFILINLKNGSLTLKGRWFAKEVCLTLHRDQSGGERAAHVYRTPTADPAWQQALLLLSLP